jgi:segregation and condensation protein B
MAFNLKRVLKALLLSTSQPLSIKDIQDTFTRFHERLTKVAPERVEQTAGTETQSSTESQPPVEESAEAPLGADPLDDPELYHEVPSLVTGSQIREAMDLISSELKAQDDGLLLIEGSSGYRLVTHPRFGRWIRALRQEPPPVKLSPSSIETLAVVAYRQPVTRQEIETIRGVSAEAGINKLMERELITITGRADQPGRPIQYGTTDAFLEYIGIKSLDELPASDVLSSRQIDQWLVTNSQTQKPTDKDVGLPEEQLSLDQAVVRNTE